MATVSLDHVTKVYANGFEAVRGIDLDIADGEFMVLVGPSGCGKTTVLRMIAGLEDISGGTLRIGERVVNEVSSKDRDIAMVFQNYALYPHMTVAENIGLPLKLRKRPKGEIRAKVTEAAQILGLTEWLHRRPRPPPGGPPHRGAAGRPRFLGFPGGPAGGRGRPSGARPRGVARGRAIVREPAVFLMDEPL